MRQLVCFALIVAGVSLAWQSTASAAAPAHDRIVSAVPSSNTPAVNNGETDAIVQVGNTVVVGGTFTSATSSGGSTVTRNYILAFNAATGQLSSTFVPTLNGSVMDLAAGPTPDTVYVGGTFSTVNGANASHVTLLNVNTGIVSGGFKAPATNGVVNTLVLRGDRLYVGGNFTTAGGVAHGGLASLKSGTGVLDPFVSNQVAQRHNDTGSGAQGAVGVRDLDVNADGSRLIAIGNFKKVDGIARDQVVMLSLSGSSSTVTSDWNTNRYQPYCFNFAFDTYVRGVSFSPDGSYFVITATGGQNAGSLCDTAARFETNASGSDLQPTWVDYTGGDTLWSVAVTEKAVYVGGHQRWLNNSLASDTAGPGAVPRPGLAALDTQTGVPLTWNPGRNPRGAAVYALYPTPNGLWMGSDTEYIGNHYQYKRPRIAFFPLAGGSTEASDATASIPGTAYLGGPTSVNGNVLYRVNAGGPTVGATDNGPDWAADDSTDSTVRNSSSNAAGWNAGGATTDATVPSSTPNAVFDSERWSPSDNPAMNWSFPAPNGAPLQVRLYFANRCGCTSESGQRVFDVSIDGTKVLDNFDIVDATGDQDGTMRSFDITSDGSVNIDFSHEVENPLIDAIEIVRTDQAPPAPGGDTLSSVDLSASGAASSADLQSDGGVAWSHVRGSFLAGGKLYYGLDDGSFYSRTTNGTTFGQQTKIDPYNDPNWAGISTGSGNTYDGKLNNFYSQITSVTGMAYGSGRLYYTLAGQSELYWRWFNTDSGIVGADQFTATGGRNWNGTMGMFVAADKLYFVTKSDGNLNSIALSAGVPTGSSSVVDGPASGGNDWRARALFLGASTAPPANVAPTASFTASCVDLTCTFDGSASVDSDGSIVSYSWDFGDGKQGSGQTVSHTYDDADTYSTTLTVKDDQSASGSTTKDVTATAPQASNIAFVGKSAANANKADSPITIPSQVTVGDTMVLTATVNNAPTVTTPAGWSLLHSEAVSGLTSYVWTRVANASDAGSTTTVSLSGVAKTTLVIAVYRGVDKSSPVAAYATSNDSGTGSHTTPSLIAPSGSWIVSYWSDKSPNTGSWSAPPSVTTRADVYSTGSGRVSSLVADSNGPSTGGSVSGETATTDVTSSKGIAWTIALKPAP